MPNPEVTQAQAATLTVPDNIQELFADGVTQNYLGLPNSRLMFHRVANITPDGTEHRVANLSLVIPTAVLFEFIINTVEASNPEVFAAIEAGSIEYAQEFVKTFKKVVDSNQSA